MGEGEKTTSQFRAARLRCHKACDGLSGLMVRVPNALSAPPPNKPQPASGGRGRQGITLARDVPPPTRAAAVAWKTTKGQEWATSHALYHRLPPTRGMKNKLGVRRSGASADSHSTFRLASCGVSVQSEFKMARFKKEANRTGLGASQVLSDNAPVQPSPAQLADQSVPPAIHPEDYPIQNAPTDDPRRFLGAIPPTPAVRARRPKRRKLQRIRDSLSQLWFICVLTLAAVAVPAGIIIAPLIGLKLDAGQPETVQQVFTPDPWKDVPRECLREVRLTDVIKDLDTHGAAPMSRPARHVADVICLYNNTRFRKLQRLDYLPAHMQLGFCQALLYWSVDVSGGTVRSRVPEFDVNFGVWKLRSLKSSLTPGDGISGILVALGGYHEDSAHFSRLGHNRALMSRFGGSVAKFVVKHGFDGVLVHWKGIGASCGSHEDARTLGKLLELLSRLFSINAYTFVGGAILPAVKETAMEVTRAIATAASLIVYETHEMAGYDVFQSCTSASDMVKSFMDDMKTTAASTRPAQLPVQCVSLSAGIRSTLAYDLAGKSVPIPDPVHLYYKSSQRFGMAAAYDMCRALAISAVTPDSSSLPGCVLYRLPKVNVTTEEISTRSQTIPIGTTIDRQFAYESATEIARQASTTSTTKARRCVAVYDLDLDLFKGTCEYRYTTITNNFRMLHIDDALV
ncbi:hypothetical protein HPB48_025599 [Haemaphysalis longicornis]|uniref:Chitinase n=1 Tax=Haemaphysalis longicornis TaxID=44386 RepID=A0A9J6HAN1_HAELO|nr:hypothetical protein HPB48_025599 [Haemaphysalis longicornis]